MFVLILCILAQLNCTVGAPPPPADVKLGLILEDFPLNFSALCKHLGLSALRYTAHSHLVGPCVINNPHRNPQSSQAATFDQRESSDSAVCSGGGEFTPEIILDDHDGDISAKPNSYVSAIWWAFAALQ